MEGHTRQHADHLTLAFEMAEKLRKAGLSAEADLSTRREHMTKVRIHLGSTDCRYLCIYSGRWGPKYSPHEMRGPDLTAVIEACWNDRIDDARALLGYTDGADTRSEADAVGTGLVAHAYVASCGPKRLSGCAIAVVVEERFEGYVETVVKADRLEAEARGVVRLLERCEERRIERVTINAGSEIIELATGSSKPLDPSMQRFKGAVKNGTVGIAWRMVDETSKGHRSALKRAKRVYDDRWFEVA